MFIALQGDTTRSQIAASPAENSTPFSKKANSLLPSWRRHCLYYSKKKPFSPTPMDDCLQPPKEVLHIVKTKRRSLSLDQYMEDHLAEHVIGNAVYTFPSFLNNLNSALHLGTPPSTHLH